MICEMSEACSKRFDRCEADIKLLQNQDNDMNGRQIRMETKLDYMTSEIQKLAVKIDTIIEQPGKRWDMIVVALVISVITGLGTAFFLRGG